METRALASRGGIRRARTSRAWYAAALLVALLAALLGAWFASGWHDVRLRQREARETPARAAEERAEEIGQDLRGELEALLAREARRPYFHYQNLMHDPKASLGVSVSPSPLAQGPDDELVLGYFQIDAQGRVTTPTINDDFPDLSEPDNLADNRAFRDQVVRDLVRELALPAGPTLVADARPVAVADAAPATRPRPRPRPRPPQPTASSPSSSGTPQAPAQQAQVIQLDPDVYVQNSNSNMVYGRQLENNALPSAVAKPAAPKSAAPSPAAPKRGAPKPAVPTAVAATPAAPKSAAPNPAAPNPAARKRVAPSPVATPNSVAPTSAAPKPTTPNSVAPRPVATPKSVAPTSAAPKPTTPNPVVSTHVAPKPAGSRPVAPKPAASRPVAPKSTARKPAEPPAPVTITISPLEWRTLAFAGGPALVAVRNVQTPDGSFAQGFVVDRSALTSALAAKAGEMVAELRPSSEVGAELRESATGEHAVPDVAAPGVAVPGVAVPGVAAPGVAAPGVAAPDVAAPDVAASEVAAGSATPSRRAFDVAPGWRLTVAPNPRTLGRAAASTADIARSFLVRFGVVGAIALVVAAFVLVLVLRAEQLARERSQFAAAAAHELRTPLAGLQLYGDMLADGLGDPGKVRDYARRMSEEASRLGRVVSNVLGFSQLERGNLSVDPQIGSLGTALCELAERAEPALDRAGATLELDVSPELQARFDRDALARIVGNLLDNAEKYARGADDRTIRLAARERGDVVEVIVADRGPGVADRATLFRAFSRGVTADGPAGLGLGLALSQSLARAMGGELAYRAGDCEGATFVLELPRA